MKLARSRCRADPTRQRATKGCVQVLSAVSSAEIPSTKACVQVLFTVSSAKLQPSNVLTKEETPRTRRTARCTNILPLVFTKGIHRSLKNLFCCNIEKPSIEQLTQKDFEYQMSAVSHQVLIAGEGIAGDRQSVREERNYAQ